MILAIVVIKLPDSVPGTRFTDYASTIYSIQLTGGCVKHSHQLDVGGMRNNWDMNNAFVLFNIEPSGLRITGF